MRITAIVERAVRLHGTPAHAVVNFSGHTVSLVALTAVAIHSGGKRVVGVAFNSIGRFAQSGILGDRMIPRVLAAPSDTLLDDSGQPGPAPGPTTSASSAHISNMRTSRPASPASNASS
jgi:hypothetical protein